MEATPMRLRLGMTLWEGLIRRYLFRKEAEDAHTATIRMLKWFQDNDMLGLLKFLFRSPYHDMPKELFGVGWQNPIGLAAGFDKQGEVLPALFALGVGSVEVGTITPEPQDGNERPRLFRYPEHHAAINRYGFNSEGVHAVLQNVTRTRREYAVHDYSVGFSVGKNKVTDDVRAVEDYLKVLRFVSRIIRKNDYVQINISSPNTPGLRDIFDHLDDFLARLMEGVGVIRGLDRVPFVLKVPPDSLTEMDYQHVVDAASTHGFVGIEATNTTTDPNIKSRYGLSEVGGLSGEPLRERSNGVLSYMREAARERGVDLVGVGGISSGEHVSGKRQFGANAVQLYTGLVFRGPILIHEALAEWRYQDAQGAYL